MDPLDVIRKLRVGGLVDPDDGDLVLDFALGLSDDELARLQAENDVPLPSELVAVLRETAGIDGIEPIDFTGRRLDVEVGEVSPSGLPIAADGSGNFWVLDLTPDDVDTAPVFYLCHDPPVLVYQSPSLGHFLNELLRMYEAPHTSTIREVREDRVFDVWRMNPGALEHEDALAGDADLRAFASSLDETFQLVDLRSPALGMGFSWGRYGPRTEVRRHGYTRIFAYARPEKKPGLLSRMFGR